MKFSPFEFLLLALATYRMALMISKESGPFWMFRHFRRVVKREAPKKTHMDEGIECLWCVSMQIGIIIAISAWFLWDHPVYKISVNALALSAVAVILNQKFTKG